MSGMIAIEAQLNGIIKEYLDYYGFDDTLDKFNYECAQKGKSIANVDKKNSSCQKNNFTINEMISLFHQGQRKEFFRRWLENIPENIINDDLVAQKLELELNIHFAVYPFKKGGNDIKAQKESMALFKNYIENKGRVLCQTKEFLPYFGLPYHQNPKEAFSEIFSEHWLNDLQKKLEEFLKETLKLQNPVKLVDLFTQQYETNDSSPNIAKLKQQLIESEKRTMAFMRKFNKVQSDYHGLIGITAELVDSLESTITGKPVTSEYISNICFRLFNTQLKQSVDFIRPGTAGDLIREKPEPKVTHPPLDYAKVKHDLINQGERRQLLILQALRWRLTKCESVEQRQRILTAYIAGDLLNCRSDRLPNNLIDLLKSPSESIRQFMARLVNAFASLNHGRSYLASNFELVKSMHTVLRMEKEDSYTRKNILAALQKLSLRHRLQMLMVNDNVIETLIDLLEKNETLSDYSLEYAIALLMNLTLKAPGKKKCAIDYKKSLKIITELLGNSNIEVQSYVNAVLYNLLSLPQIRAHAKVMNVESILKDYIAEGTVEINQQRELIIRRINTSDESIQDEDAENQDDDEDDDEEEDAEMMEVELDSGEPPINKQQDEPSGDLLLISEYSVNNPNGIAASIEARKSKSKMENNEIDDTSVIKRPITPFTLRQSQQFTKSQTPNKANNSSYQRQSPAFSNAAASNDVKTSSNNKTNILVIESNDTNVDESYAIDSKYPPATNDSLNVFANRQKIQRTPDPSTLKPTRKVSIVTTTSMNASSSIKPQYSILEPRPSSANSTKSKNSSSSSTLNQNDSAAIYSNSKAKIK